MSQKRADKQAKRAERKSRQRRGGRDKAKRRAGWGMMPPPAPAVQPLFDYEARQRRGIPFAPHERAPGIPPAPWVPVPPLSPEGSELKGPCVREVLPLAPRPTAPAIEPVAEVERPMTRTPGAMRALLLIAMLGGGEFGASASVDSTRRRR